MDDRPNRKKNLRFLIFSGVMLRGPSRVTFRHVFPLSVPRMPRKPLFQVSAAEGRPVLICR